MKYVIGTRGSGITTDPLLESLMSDNPILVPTLVMKAQLTQKCDKLCITHPDFITLPELRGMKGNISIDNARLLLEILLYKHYGFEGEITTIGDSIE